ncbi:HdaA/DnaA family protein [Hyphococcus sp.]|uniref:HdaA/DnaA family protein n=1 Tax=Hyphococcus sp. TaxID=2038636 RepID=UPI003D133DE5
MLSAARQLSLNLPETPPRYDRASFVRADCNAAAWRAGEAWLASAEPALVVCGPSGAGKTHFAYALLEGLDPTTLTADALAAAPYGDGVAIIDNMPAADPHAFLDALETGAGKGRRFVLAGEGHPSLWAMGLKDLRTRLEAAPRAVLADPDEALIRAVIAKGFRDRQVAVSPAVIEYAVPRLPRTFAAARMFVALADRAALEEKRKITTPFIQKLLDNLSEGDPAA